MKKLTEGHKMWASVMVIFLVYAAIFIIFEDYDRKNSMPLDEPSEWRLLVFSIVVMAGLGWLLFRYARRMDERISREQAAKENEMRRQLTQNIAHELKTPVASILGFTDTIIDNPGIDDAVKQQFVVRANAQARRLTALLQDISALNRMDYAPQMLAHERVDVSALVADIVEETAMAAASRQMRVRNCLPGGISIEGNWSLLYSVFRNLMDNAISYAGNGTTVTMAATLQAGCWRFTFADNGIGVDTEHLPHLFERFYRVDKGRSRSLGGTGLGLAVVKNAVQLHGGNIVARANAGAGLCFEFTLRGISEKI